MTITGGHDVPAIWLYPRTKAKIQLSLAFQGRGQMTDSVPPYNDGWSVLVNPGVQFGRITPEYGDGTAHAFLDYDGLRDGAFQTRRGWIVAKSEFLEVHSEQLKTIGFLDNEVFDAMYCYGRTLVDRSEPYIALFPQNQRTVDASVKMKVTPKADTTYRLWFLVQMLRKPITVLPPVVDPVRRRGFTVIELGYHEAADVAGTTLGLKSKQLLQAVRRDRG